MTLMRHERLKTPLAEIIQRQREYGVCVSHSLFVLIKSRANREGVVLVVCLIITHHIFFGDFFKSFF